MKITYQIDAETVAGTKAMLRSEIKSRPISMSQIFYARTHIESSRDGKSIDMGRIPLVFFLIDVLDFIVSGSNKGTINDENQNYTVYLENTDDIMFASFVKDGGIKNIEFDLPKESEISEIAKVFIGEYINLVPELEGYSNMKYVYEELNILSS